VQICIRDKDDDVVYPGRGHSGGVDGAEESRL